ncbi:MAG TPA: tetratricopeptide repeat protein [Desulfuromonadaceae bacterium]|nr:tetratricopeptide repeat protein [Desulfuromonadaceae bacterium]
MLPLKHLKLFVGIALVIGTIAVYGRLFHAVPLNGPTTSHGGYGFIDYDDPDYIVGNEHVKNGLTWSGIRRAFTSGEAANWHPLTWISHMIDCQLFGLNASGHHLVNVLFHAANAVLLFLLLNRLTSAIWRSALVAALFAWHPLHVESVAWASERKDVLSAFFAFLSLLAYVRYARRIEDGRRKAEGGVQTSGFRPLPSAFWYLASGFWFACGLMSKPMIVTLPFVMLLLDFWPLNRMRSAECGVRNISRLIVEKIPFFLLTVASCLITLRVQREAMWSPENLPLPLRLENAVVAYIRYLFKIVWPTDLALIYPYHLHWPVTLFLAALFCLVVWTAVFIQRIREKPYLMVGWLWFLGTLVPVIGIVQVGATSMADRYTYLPATGIFILIVWALADFAERLPNGKRIGAIFGSAAVAGCVIVTSVQLQYWRSSVDLFWHTIKVTDNNYAAYDCFGKALENIGKMKEAENFYKDAVQVNPGYPMAQFDLGMILVQRGDAVEASNHLAAAVSLMPRNPVMQFDFGVFLSEHGQPDEAAGHFRAALEERPNFTEAKQRLDALTTNTQK